MQPLRDFLSEEFDVNLKVWHNIALEDQDKSVDRNEYSVDNYQLKQHASTAYGTLANQNYKYSNSSFLSA